jgi:hypothetical protein
MYGGVQGAFCLASCVAVSARFSVLHAGSGYFLLDLLDSPLSG